MRESFAEHYRGLFAVAYRDLISFSRGRVAVFSSLILPLGFLVFIGIGLDDVVDPSAVGASYLKFVYPGMIAMALSQTALFGGAQIFWDRQYGYLKMMLAAPVSRLGIIGGKITAVTVISLFQVAAMLVVAPFIGVSVTGWVIPALFLYLVLFSVAVGSLGVLIGVRIRSPQSAQMVGVVTFPLTFMSGMFFPVNSVPTWLEVLAKINPLTYPVAGIREVLLSRTDPDVSTAVLEPFAVHVFGYRMGAWENALVAAGFGVVLLAAATWSFSRQE